MRGSREAFGVCLNPYPSTKVLMGPWMDTSFGEEKNVQSSFKGSRLKWKNWFLTSSEQ